MERDLVSPQTIPDEVLIPNFPQFIQKLKSMKASGPSHLHLIADYDLTLTKYSTNSIRGCSTYQLLQSSVLKGDHADYIQSLYNYYHPIEIDPSIPFDTKQQLMHEWWDKSNQAILDESFSNADLPGYIINSTLHFRHGIRELISQLNNKSIPLTIISGGIGNLIEESLKFVGPNIKNLQVFSNFIAFNELGRASHFTLPEVRTDKSRVLAGTAVRKNLILLGDLPADAKMADAVQYENCIRVGFINNVDVYEIKNYEEVFDVLVMHDGDLSFVNYLIAVVAGEGFDWDTYASFKWVDERIAESE